MYIDAKLIDDDGENGLVYVSQRSKEGVREITSHMPPYVFYYPDRNGTHTSIYGDKLRPRRFHKRMSFFIERKKMREAGVTLFESDMFSDRDPASVPGYLRVVTWNIHRGEDALAALDELQSNSVLASADFILLQECPRNDTLSVPLRIAS